MIQAAINGNRSEAHVPRSSASIASAALSVVKAGASSIHFHVCDGSGNETLAGKWVDEQIVSLRKNLKQTPLGISTGAWIEPDLDKRLEQIKSWKMLPDFVSINFEEYGYQEVAKLVTAKEISIEAGLSDVNSALNFVNSKLGLNCIRVLIEPQEITLPAAKKTVKDIEELLERNNIRLPVLLHGFNDTCWGMLELAFKKRYLTRIGFEDTLFLPDGSTAATNLVLLKAAQNIKTAVHNA